MAQKISFVCDICKKEFSARDNQGQILPVGGMNGFYKKTITDPKDKTLKPVLMQYAFDLCPDCNKKMVDKYFELGGK